MDVLDRADLPFPHSLPEFQRLFPDDAACAAYLEKARWGDGFACPHCGTAGEPFHFENSYVQNLLQKGFDHVAECCRGHGWRVDIRYRSAGHAQPPSGGLLHQLAFVLRQ